MPVEVITEKRFEDLFKEKLDNFYERALSVFRNYGKSLSFDVANVLLHAFDEEKINEILSALEKHWEEHLQFQHPEIRGQISKNGVNPTQVMFLRICKDILQLQPVAE